MTRKVFVLFLFFITSTVTLSQTGKLAKGKQSLKENRSVKPTFSSSTTKATSSKRSQREYNEDLGFGFLLKELFVKLFAYTAYGLVVESPFEKESKMHDAELSNYPYKQAYFGNYIYTDSINYNITRLDVYTSYVKENNNLSGVNLGVDFRFLKRLSLGVHFTELKEKTITGKESFSSFSSLLKYHRIRTQKIDAWFGLGFLHVGNNVNNSGFAFGLGADWFVTKPVSIRVSHKWANINKREVNNLKLLLKYHINRYHIASGYEHFKIGPSKINTFSVGIGASF
ncbi:hypothetical protein [uncultured Polaribacter sp.]|uniref:hypothetical protein n=1 Tax=uncultured Polaribacter sp. TaxID=174711 RepID=UPI00261B49FD|nr:hypothetical protein [uncultured Polaribacter sp.]